MGRNRTVHVCYKKKNTRISEQLDKRETMTENPLNAHSSFLSINWKSCKGNLMLTWTTKKVSALGLADSQILTKVKNANFLTNLK